MIFPSPLATTAAALRSSQLDLFSYMNEVCNRIDTVDPRIHALLPETNRRVRLIAEARALQVRFPDSASRPPLFGVLVGVKDVFRADGFPTQAGSQLPAELLAGPEAKCVTLLRNAGALIMGKTISTEFAFAEPGPTRNPHNLDHTPGGSSSGSAAAVGAGFCSLALGTQTIGSVIRPAAFCGIVGFKPTYGRIPTTGLIMFSQSVDTVGFFTQDVPGAALAASVLCKDWQAIDAGATNDSASLPVLGVPDGPYLNQASSEGLEAFEMQLVCLQDAGYTVRRISVLQDIETINHRHMRMIFAEMAQVHAAWFAQYESLYRPRTTAAIREGQGVDAEELKIARNGRTPLRNQLETAMAHAGIDLWICPAAPGPAPEGISTTGNPIMNLPWTYAGMPVMSVPAGRVANGLPLGLQVIAPSMADEQLVLWAQQLARVFMGE
jgi:Asp-tRNA(Asn)/Glu-tRNA(Gln) amidotransferase A subunit family amidase